MHDTMGREIMPIIRYKLAASLEAIEETVEGGDDQAVLMRSKSLSATITSFIQTWTRFPGIRGD